MENNMTVMKSRNGNFTLRQRKGVTKDNFQYTCLEVLSFDNARKHVVDIRFSSKEIYIKIPPVDEYNEVYISYGLNNSGVKRPSDIREFIAILEEAMEFTEHLQSIIDDNGGTISADYFDDKEMEK